MSSALQQPGRRGPQAGPRGAGWVLGVGLLYLLAECWLNLLVLDQAAGHELQASTLQWLLPAGRLLGGLGLTLVVVRVAAGWLGMGTLRSWLLAMPLCMAGMWYGQAEVLNRLVDLSSGEQRRLAFHAALLAVPAQAQPGAPTSAAQVQATLKTVLAPLLDDPLPLDSDSEAALRERIVQSLAPACNTARCPCPVAAAWLPAAQGQGPVSEVPALPTLRRCLLQPRLVQADAAFARYQGAGDGRQAAATGTQAAQAAAPDAPAPLPAGLSRSEFDERTGTHRKFRRALQARSLLAETEECTEQLRLDADDALLDRCVRQPLLLQALDTKRQLLQWPASAFEAGGEQAALGRAAYRRAIGVPVALGFSLFFTTLNACLLLLGVLELALRRWRPTAQRGAAPALATGTAKLALGLMATLAFGAGRGPALPTLPASTAELDRQAATWIWHAEPRAVALLQGVGLAPALGHWQPPEPAKQLLRRLDDHL